VISCERNRSLVRNITSVIVIKFTAHDRLIDLVWSSLSSEAKSASASQEIVCILRSPNVKFLCLHKSSPLVPILSQINSYQTLQSSFFMIHCNIITPCTPLSSKWPLSFRLSHQSRENITVLSHECHMPSPVPRVPHAQCCPTSATCPLLSVFINLMFVLISLFGNEHRS
jgi:hypothetical protein